MKYIYSILFLSLFTILFSSGYAQQSAMYDAESVKEDLSFLYETLEKSHVDLYANTPKIVFDKAYKEIGNNITDSLTLIQIDRMFHPFVSLAGDGHTTLELPIASYVIHLRNGGTIFPLTVYFKNNRVYVWDNFSADSSIKPGDEIISINGSPIDTVLTKLYSYIPGENTYTKNLAITSLSFPRLFWIVYGTQHSFTVEIKKGNVEVRKSKISPIPVGSFEARMAARKPISNSERAFYFIDDVAYLRPGQFFNNTQEDSLINANVIDNADFVHFVDSCFYMIHKQNTGDLILDLRGNPGGTAAFSNPLLAYFATEPFIGSENFKIRSSKVAKDFWKDVADTSKLFQDIRRQILSAQNGERFEIDATKYTYPPRKDSLKFEGNIYVLIDGYTYSQAIEVGATIQKYGFGTLIGEPTTPLVTANARQFKLPNTQLTVTFPEAYYGDSLMKNGVFPDYTLWNDVLTEQDEILGFTLNMIAEANEQM